MKKNNNFFSSAMRYNKIIFFVVIVLVAFGVYGLTEMGKNEFPEFTIRQGVVVGVYPGATPTEIEEQLTKPLENFLFTYQEIDKTKTYSYSRDGMVYVFVELSNSVKNQTEAWSKIRHGLKDFKMTLPSGVLAIVVKDDFGNTSSLLITMESQDKTYRELGTLMDNLCSRLRSIKSVGNINVFGKQNEEILIYIQPEKLATYGISTQTIMANLFAQNFQTLSGSIKNSDLSAPIHISTNYKSEKELEEQIIFSTPEGKIIRLKDVAEIKREYSNAGSYIKNNGNKSLVLSIEMSSGNNIVKFGNEVEKTLEEFESEIPSSVKIMRITDQPKMVDDSVKGFLRDIVLSILIVIAVMLMLFPLRSALVAAISIPISVAITLAVMYITNIELNTVTLAVLIVVLGMIVDNSIVVIDGYIGYLRLGHSRWYAAVKSAKDYFPALFLATVAICGMFFPTIGIFTGTMGDFIAMFPITLTIALMLSLAVSVLIIPYLEYSFILPDNPSKKKNLFSRIQDKFFVGMQNIYNKTIEKCFQHPVITITVAVVSIVCAVLMFLVVPIQMMPKAERDCFAVEIFLPTGSTLDETSFVCDSLNKILQKEKNIIAVTEFVGMSSPRFHATYAPNLPGENYAQFIVKTKSNDATIELLKKYSSMENYFPQAVLRFKQLDYQVVTNPIEVRFKGENIEELKQQADKVVVFMNTLNEDLSWVHTSSNGSMPFAKIELHQDEATRLGITKGTLSATLASSFNGVPLTTIWEDDYAVPVKLLTYRNEKNQTNFDNLKNEIIPTGIPNVWVPLRQVADISVDWQDAQIMRRNGVNCVNVGADLKFGKSQPVVMKKINKYIDEEITPNLPEGVTIELGGLTEVNEQTIPEVVLCIIAAITIIFIFLLLSFKKISISILSLTSCLLCLFGSCLGLLIFGQDFGLTSVLGVVSLIGIIVRNAIIMFEYAEELRSTSKMSIKEIAMEAGKRRMRPIFLTSATTAVGVIPMIISRSTLWMPMGIVICFGTVFSIFLIITILPVLYWLVYKKNEKKNIVVTQ